MLLIGVSPRVFSKFTEKVHHVPQRILDPQLLTISRQSEIEDLSVIAMVVAYGGSAGEGLVPSSPIG
jgi:hypothetical protein